MNVVWCLKEKCETAYIIQSISSLLLIGWSYVKYITFFCGAGEGDLGTEPRVSHMLGKYSYHQAIAPDQNIYILANVIASDLNSNGDC